MSINSKEFTHRIKLDNKIIDDMLKIKQKRALFIYIYLLRNLKSKSITTISLAELATYLNLPAVSKNIKTIKLALNHLVEKGLIGVYEDRFKEQNITDMADIKTNILIHAVAQESSSEAFYTLVDVDVIDKILYKKSDETIEDMMALVVLLCRQIERRDEVLQVAWYSSDKLTDMLGIKNKRFKPLIDEMKGMKVIYFDKAIIGKKEHYIYSMFENADQVAQAKKIAEANRRLDVRVKLDGHVDLTDVVEKNVEEETGEIIWLPTSYEVEKLLRDINYELNDYSAPLLNRVAKEYSQETLCKIIRTIIGEKIEGTNQYINIATKDNTTGFVVSGLQKSLSA